MARSSTIPLRSVLFFYALMTLAAGIWIYAARLPVTLIGIEGLVEAYFLGIALFVISLMLSAKFQWAKELERLFAEVLTPLSWPVIFLLALLSSVSEELFFRGAAQNQFGLIPASLLFGLIHFPVRKTMIPWTLMAVVMGFLLGGLYIYAGNLLAPITLHFLINFANIWIINQKYME